MSYIHSILSSILVAVLCTVLAPISYAHFVSVLYRRAISVRFVAKIWWRVMNCKPMMYAMLFVGLLVLQLSAMLTQNDLLAVIAAIASSILVVINSRQLSKAILSS